MHLIKKIKSYFLKNEFSLWKDFRMDDYELKFTSLTDEVLLDIAGFVKANLQESNQIGNVRHRLPDTTSVQCNSLDEVMVLIKTLIAKDYTDTLLESVQYDWDFKYFVSEHRRCANTICISNALKSSRTNTGNCIYPIISIRKFDNTYYCWNHLE